MMKNLSPASVCFMVFIATAANTLLREAELGGAVTCSAVQLSPCLGAIQSSSTPPSAQCCSRLKEQQPCLCGYLKDPNLRQYVNSPNARKVASTCGVPVPSNC